MNSYTTYTGTFVKQDGKTRTMTFIKTTDLPQHMRDTTKTRNLAEGMETVFDVNAKSFRTFNWNTHQGTIRKDTTNFSFDKTN